MAVKIKIAESPCVGRCSVFSKDSREQANLGMIGACFPRSRIARRGPEVRFADITIDLLEPRFPERIELDFSRLVMTSSANSFSTEGLTPDQIQARSLSISANTVNSLRTALLNMRLRPTYTRPNNWLDQVRWPVRPPTARPHNPRVGKVQNRDSPNAGDAWA